jgi:hypothetical protein
MMKFLLNNKIVFIGIVAGAIAGYAYFHFVGCNGTCLITSSPVRSSLYGGVMGGLLLSIFKKEKNTNRGDDKNQHHEN